MRTLILMAALVCGGSAAALTADPAAAGPPVPVAVWEAAAEVVGDGNAPVVLEGGRDGSRALVIALHGGTWTGKRPQERAARLKTDLSSDARRAGLRLLVPVVPERSDDDQRISHVPWLSAEGEALVLALIAQEVEAGRADERRVYLAGHGSGATGALMLAARHHDLIAGVAAWSGVPSPLWDEDRRVVGLTEDVVRGLRRVAVYLWTGQDDEILDRDTLRWFVRELTAQREQLDGAEWLWDEGPGEHGFGAQGPGRGLRFLKKQRKQVRR
jgi:poly(3-hydroxybutyrate) depolymerase